MMAKITPNRSQHHRVKRYAHFGLRGPVKGCAHCEGLHCFEHYAHLGAVRSVPDPV